MNTQSDSNKNNKDNINNNNSNNSDDNNKFQKIINKFIIKNNDFSKENKDIIINQIINIWSSDKRINNHCSNNSNSNNNDNSSNNSSYSNNNNPIQFLKELNFQFNKIQFKENNENQILFLLGILYELVNSYLSLHIVETQDLLNYYLDSLSIDKSSPFSLLIGGSSVDLFILLSLLKYSSFKKQIFEILNNLIKESYDSNIDNTLNNNNNNNNNNGNNNSDSDNSNNNNDSDISNNNNNSNFKEIFFQSIRFLVVILKIESNNVNVVFSDSLLELLNDVFLLFEILQIDQIQNQPQQQELELQSSRLIISNNYLFKFSVDCLKYIYFKMNGNQIWKLFLFKYYFQIYSSTNSLSVIHKIVYSCLNDLLNYTLDQDLDTTLQIYQDENILNNTNELIKEIINILLVKQEKEIEIDNDGFENLKLLSLIIQNYLIVDSIFQRVQDSIIKVELLSTKYFNLASFFYINLFGQFDRINNYIINNSSNDNSSNNSIILSKKNQDIIVTQINNIVSISIHIPSFHSYSIFQYIQTVLQKQKDNKKNNSSNNNLLKVYSSILKYIHEKLKKSCFSEISYNSNNNNNNNTLVSKSLSSPSSTPTTSTTTATQKFRIDFNKIINNIDLSIEPIHFYLIILFTLPPFKHESQLILQSIVNDLSNIDSIIELLSKVSNKDDHNLSTIQNIIIKFLSPLYNYLINLYIQKDKKKCIGFILCYNSICEIFKVERSREVQDSVISSYSRLNLKTISGILINFIENYLKFKQVCNGDNIGEYNGENPIVNLSTISYGLELLLLNFENYLSVNQFKDIEELFETLLLLFHLMSDRLDKNFVNLIKFNQVLTCQFQLSQSPYPLVNSLYNSLNEDSLDNPVYIMKLILILVQKVLNVSDPTKFSIKSWNYLDNNINSIKQLLIVPNQNSNSQQQSLNLILILYYLNKLETEDNKILVNQYLELIVTLLKLNNIKDISKQNSLINNHHIINKLFSTLSILLFNDQELNQDSKLIIYQIFDYINNSIQAINSSNCGGKGSNQEKEFLKNQKEIIRSILFDSFVKLLFNSTIQVNKEKYDNLLELENDSKNTPNNKKLKSLKKNNQNQIKYNQSSKLIIDSILISIVSNFPNTITNQDSISSLNHLGEIIYIHLNDYINLELLEKYIYLFVDIFFPLLNKFSQNPSILDQLSLSKSNLAPPNSLVEILDLNHHNRIKQTLLESILDLTNSQVIKDLVLNNDYPQKELSKDEDNSSGNNVLNDFIKMICRAFYITTYLLGDEHSYHLSEGFLEKLYDLMVTFKFIYLYLLGSSDSDNDNDDLQFNNDIQNIGLNNNNNNSDDPLVKKIKQQQQNHLLRQQQQTPSQSSNKKKKGRKLFKSPQVTTNLVNQYQNRVRSRHPFIDSCLRSNQENVDNNIDTYADLEDFIIVKKGKKY